MSATVAAALKKIAVAVLTDKKLRRTVLSIVLGVIIIIIMPVAAVISLFNGDIEIDTDRLHTLVVENLSAEGKAKLQAVEDMMKAIESAMTERGFTAEKTKEAQALYIFFCMSNQGMKALPKGCPPALQRIRPTSNLLPLLIPHSARSLKQRITVKF